MIESGHSTLPASAEQTALSKLRDVLIWAAFAWLLFACIPTPPVAGGAGIDASWVWALNMAAAKGLIYGKDIAFTYGPLGHLNIPQFPEARQSSFLAYAGFIYLCWATAFWSLAAGVKDWATRLLIVSATGLTYVGLAVFLWDQFELALIGLTAVILSQRERPPWACVVLLAIGCGLAPLSRLHTGVEAALLLGYVCFFLKPARKALLCAAIAPAVTLTAWILSGNPLSALPNYVRLSVDIVSGYAEAMGYAGPMREVALALAAITALALLCWRFTLPALFPAMVVAGLSFKHAMTRQDTHTITFHLKIAAASLFLLACSRTLQRKQWTVLFMMANLAAGLWISTGKTPVFLDAFSNRLSLNWARAYLNVYLDFNTACKWGHEESARNLQVRKLDAVSREKLGNESTDIFPDLVDIARANNLNWSPRPVFQSYSAYTPLLDAANAAHYAESARPKNILLQWVAIDGRHLFLNDPITFRALLENYRFESESNQGQLLIRRENPQPATESSAGSREGSLDEWFDVPQAGPGELILAKARVELSWAGKLHNMALRAAPVMLHVDDSRGVRAYRTVRANLVSGFIASEMPAGADEGRAFLQRQWGNGERQVRRIRFTCPSANQMKREVRVEWVRLRYPPGQ